jgi:hypothetical protein
MKNLLELDTCSKQSLSVEKNLGENTFLRRSSACMQNLTADSPILRLQVFQFLVYRNQSSMRSLQYLLYLWRKGIVLFRYYCPQSI